MKRKYAWLPTKVETWKDFGPYYYVWLQEYILDDRTCLISGRKFPYKYVTALDGIYWNTHKFKRLRTMWKHLMS